MLQQPGCHRLTRMGHGVFEKFVKIVAVGFGSGLSPLAPGTVGTLVGIPLFLLFATFSRPLYLLSVTALFFLAVFVSQEAEKLFRERDPSRVVIDEVVGFLVTMFLVAPTTAHILLGFLLFRLFDITKPFPIRACERRLPGGYGIVGDDVVAGVYANVVLQLIIALTGL